EGSKLQPQDREPSMSDKPISDLRRRMIADMTIRTFSDRTQRDYIRQIEAFASFLGRSPDPTTGDDIRRFQLAQVEQGAQPPKMNAQASSSAAPTLLINWPARIIRASCRVSLLPIRSPG